jgi:hypothetical protein
MLAEPGRWDKTLVDTGVRGGAPVPGGLATLLRVFADPAEAHHPCVIAR